MLDHLRSLREGSDALIQREISQQLRRSASHEQLAQTLAIAETRDLTHAQLARIKRRNLPIPRALSFSAIMVQRFEATRIGAPGLGARLDSKRTGYAFADAIGLRRPKSDLELRALDEIQPAYPMVIKPARSTGAKGVFLCFAPSRILHLRDRAELRSWDEMRAVAKKLRTGAGQPLADRWLAEELILEGPGSAARDLKFYAFYGDVQLVLEIVRVPEFRACWWGPDGERLDPGKYADKALDGVGATSEQLELAAMVSREVPRPFMRIDMLRGHDELALGEFTPRPGGFEKFDAAWDRRLGEAWTRGEHRLLTDLLDGKSFGAYRAVTDQ